MKKLLCFMLVICLTVGLFGACGRKEGTDKQDANNTPASGQQTPATDGTNEETELKGKIEFSR